LGERENQAGGWRRSATGAAAAHFWPSWPEVPGLVRKKGNKKHDRAEILRAAFNWKNYPACVDDMRIM